MKVSAKKNYFKFLKKRNVKLFSIFFAAAFFFLMLTKFSKTYNQTIDLEVKLYNLEDDIVILNDSFATAKVTVSAKGFSLLDYMFNPTKEVEVDASSEATKKGNKLFWDLNSNKYKLKTVIGKSIDILSVKPDTVFFNFDVLASKVVPVKLLTDVDYAEGYDSVDVLKLSQDSVKIVGSKNKVNAIKFLKTDTLKLRDVKSNIIKDIAIKDKFSNVKIVPDHLTIKSVVKRFTEGKFLIPVTPINTLNEKKINFFPKEVELIFYIDIDNYKTVKPEDFKVIADFSELTNQNQNTLNLKITDYPKKVKNARLLQNSIEFIISD